MTRVSCDPPSIIYPPSSQRAEQWVLPPRVRSFTWLVAGTRLPILPVFVWGYPPDLAEALFCISRKRILILSCVPQAEAGDNPPSIWGAGANSTDPTGAQMMGVRWSWTLPSPGRQLGFPFSVGRVLWLAPLSTLTRAIWGRVPPFGEPGKQLGRVQGYDGETGRMG